MLTLQLSGGTFSAGGAVVFRFGGVTNPTSIQSQVNNVNAVTTTSTGVVVGGSVTGVQPSIVSIIGPLDPRVYFPFAPRNSSSLSMQVSFTLVNSFPSGGQLLLTLSGAGLSVFGIQNVTFLTSLPGVDGVASMNSDLVLSFRLTSGSLVSGLVSFSILGVQTPYDEQGEIYGLYGSIVSSSNFVVAAFINASMSRTYAWLGYRMPALRLQPSIRGHESTRLEISFVAEHFFVRAALLVISVPTLCVQFAPASTVNFVSPALQTYDTYQASATIGSGLLRLSISYSTQSTQGQLFTLFIDNVACPSSSLPKVEGITATLYDHNSNIIGLSNSGTLERVAETLGVKLPQIALSSQMPGARNVTVVVKLKPADVPVSPSSLVITIPGKGFSVSNSQVLFAAPNTDAVAAVSVVASNTNTSFSVLTINISSGTFIPRQTLEFQLPNSFNNAEAAQVASNSVSAAWLFSNNSICAASISGYFPEIFPLLPPSTAQFGCKLNFIASPLVHGFEFDIDVTMAVSASMSNISFSQRKFSDHVVLTVVPAFIGRDQLSVFYLKQGGLRQSIFACPAIFEFMDENLCLSLSYQTQAALDLLPQTYAVVIDNLPVLLVQWQGYIKPLRQELLNFEVQALGRIRLWLDGILQVDAQVSRSADLVSHSVNITSKNSLLLFRLEYVGHFPQNGATVFWSSKRMSRRVRKFCSPVFVLVFLLQ